MLLSLIAPLLSLDAQHCREEGKGGYLFIKASKPGGAREIPEDRLICPECKTPMGPSLKCTSCNRRYPTASGIPLLAVFFAEALS